MGVIASDAEATAELIAAGRFSPVDRKAGVSGGCAKFALALHHVLHLAGIDHVIVACCDSDDGNPIYLDGELACWSHFAVRVDGLLFDIRGSVPEKALHDEFSSDILVDVDPSDLSYMDSLIMDTMPPMLRRHTETWQTRLAEAAQCINVFPETPTTLAKP